MRPRFAQSEACRHPLVLGAVVKCGAQPGAGMSLAELDNLRCDSLIGSSDSRGAHSLLRTTLRASCLRSSLIITTASDQNSAPSTFDVRRGKASSGLVPKLGA